MRSIIHVDGDSFFVSCELLKRPDLQDKAVITGKERGIASSMNMSAKKLGITRGMPVFKIRKEYPSVVILDSNYKLYEQYNQKILSVAKRFSNVVEDYSIDECFLEIGDESSTLEENIITAQNFKKELQNETGLTFSLGLAPTKVLAKVASKNKKPNGFTVLTEENREQFLEDLDIESIWGIGYRSARRFRAIGIRQALDFYKMDLSWIDRNLYVSYRSIWHELHGKRIFEIETKHDLPKSIQSTRTFPQATYFSDEVFSHLSRNIEISCKRLREMSLFTNKVAFFVKEHETFRKKWVEVELLDFTNYPDEIMSQIQNDFKKIFKKSTKYRSSGITCYNLCQKEDMNLSLFGDPFKKDALYETIDSLSEKFGENSIILASSMGSVKSFQSSKEKILLKQKYFPMPYLGEVN